MAWVQAAGQHCHQVRAVGGDQRPHIKPSIHWASRNKQRWPIWLTLGLDDSGLLRIEQGNAWSITVNPHIPPIHVAVCNIATILDTLAWVLGAYYAVMDLANVFFRKHLTTESQDHSSFTWRGQRWIFSRASPRLPAWSHHMSWDGSWDLFSFPTSVQWAHYSDDILFTCEDLPLLQNTLQALLGHSWGRGWTLNPQIIQSPGTTIKFFGGI